ncbi:epigen-like isoform X1 [Brienomyrus brachyistius]|uniref:epigen-like isoform X1 n=1 Tax=Brienomyrus brachyistius TaxID=42636 RepID=UPI0020B236DA|nr:epigen-like isoform X1 [Brienomyrus brachyistius]
MPQDTRTHTDRAVLALTTLVLVAFVGADVEPTGTTAPSVPTDGSHTPNGTGSVELPRVLKVMSPCTGEKENFCVNGVCGYDPELNTPSCTCPPNFTGVRCQHILMNSHSQENPEALIAIGAGVAVLLCCLAGAIYCCMKKRCRNTNQPYQICRPERAV